MSNNSIFKIDQEFDELLSVIDEQEGYLTEEQEKRLQELEGDIDKKVHNYAYAVKREEANQMIIDEEIKRLQSLKRISENKVKSIKSLIRWALHKYGTVNKTGSLSFQYPDLKISTRNTPVVSIDDSKIDSMLLHLYSGSISQDRLEEIKDYISLEAIVRVPATRVKDFTDNLAYLELGDSKFVPKINKIVLKERLKDKIEDFATDYLNAQLVTSESIIIK